jgi:hypothetical protein
MLLDPLEHELAERLAAAGDRARSSRSVAPDRAFGADLRDRLMTAAGEREGAGDRAGDRANDRERVRVAWSLPSLFRVPRLVPVAVATLLLIAGVVAARELYVAIGNRPEPTPTPTAAPSLPLVVPLESASMWPVSADPSAVLEPTAAPTAKPTPKPTAKPTAAPTPGVALMTLSATGCDGGVVLSWSTYEGAGFNHYTTLRNTTGSIPKAYPPQGGAVDPGGNHTTNVAATSAVDAGVAPGTTYFYRSMAFNADDGVIGASSVVSAVAGPVASLGALSVTPNPPDSIDLTWTPYAGSADCFTWYKLVYSLDPSPSYLNGDAYLAALSTQSTGFSTASVADLAPGDYYLRVQVIRSTELGLFVAAQSDVTTYTIP